jgi:hypothetical protein
MFLNTKAFVLCIIKKISFPMLIILIVVIKLVDLNPLLLSADATGCPREDEVVLEE